MAQDNVPRTIVILFLVIGCQLLDGARLSAEEFGIRIQAIDSVSGKPVPGAWITVRSQQISGEWPEQAGGETDGSGWIELAVSGEGFLIKAEKKGYEDFTFGGCSGYLLAKVVMPEEFRTIRRTIRAVVENDREVLIYESVRHLETDIFLTPRKMPEQKGLPVQVVKKK